MSVHVNPAFDVVTVGRAVVDLYPADDGRAPKDVDSYRQYLGGSPTNVAVAASRAGLRSAVVTRTGDDLFHDFVVDRLEAFGVDSRWALAVPGRRTTLAVCDLQEPHEPGLTFFRDPQPPEESLDADELGEAAAASRVLWITASGFASEQSAAAHTAAFATADQVFLDLDYRADFWASESDVRDRLRPVLGRADAVIGNVREVEIALGTSGTPADIARELLDSGPRLVVVKEGAKGALAATAEGMIEQAAFDVQTINGLGAGDAFGGQLVHGATVGLPLEDTMRNAVAAGAIVASRRGCSVAMPTMDEVAQFLQSRSEL
ncbi:PfkB family carbohydrate kinase [Microbacterium sp. AK031]|uniref:PfkB family carbohydrate kinase n=1 Tax=Microbacterium sp. AK031 TaxID=2723076 RepID=UPI002168B5A3|nr:PfkB family carbohydrate kinase [Microbacterium sp. AK031]MCS3843164.1 5-dehydro-2-deoxygluconokinase [Microbacterium sp. AK031]